MVAAKMDLFHQDLIAVQATQEKMADAIGKLAYMTVVMRCSTLCRQSLPWALMAEINKLKAFLPIRKQHDGTY